MVKSVEEAVKRYRGELRRALPALRYIERCLSLPPDPVLGKVLSLRAILTEEQAFLQRELNAAARVLGLHREEVTQLLREVLAEL